MRRLFFYSLIFLAACGRYPEQARHLLLFPEHPEESSLSSGYWEVSSCSGQAILRQYLSGSADSVVLEADIGCPFVAVARWVEGGREQALCGVLLTGWESEDSHRLVYGWGRPAEAFLRLYSSGYPLENFNLKRLLDIGGEDPDLEWSRLDWSSLVLGIQEGNFCLRDLAGTSCAAVTLPDTGGYRAADPLFQEVLDGLGAGRVWTNPVPGDYCLLPADPALPCSFLEITALEEVYWLFASSS